MIEVVPNHDFLESDKLSIAEYFTVHKISSDPKIKYPLEIHPGPELSLELS